MSERRPDARVCVFEKEPGLGAHQSGHNSGVIYSGIYYKPGSLKAALCRNGKQALERFCRDEAVEARSVGKLIVATSAAELPALEDLFQRGLANGVDCQMIDSDEARRLEPRVGCVQAIWVPETGIVSYPQVLERMARRLIDRGHELRTGMAVTGVAEGAGQVELATSGGARKFEAVVNCAGLHSDQIARLAGLRPSLRIVGFRGEYLALSGPLREQVHHLVYPVPDPRFPFLGVHLTPTLDGQILCGPNAVLALAREGYAWRSVDPVYTVRTLLYPGMLRLAWRYGRMGLGEVWRSLNKGAFANALARMLPGVRAQDLLPATAGVRAQALAPDGTLVDDFVFLETDRTVHLVNAPSPAATACLAIGDAVVDRLEARL